MLTQRQGHRLDDWINEVRASDLQPLRSFAEGLLIDHDAVVAGLTLPYSNGPAEGVINKIKLLKRQMYGRAGLALLRKRILLASARNGALPRKSWQSPWSDTPAWPRPGRT
ncbi:transposase [Nonomuraea composti]|uniref:transposase n=1 Tax=Nonomuraea composti TaxID=2720023 RepID=UPI003D17BE5F